MATVENDILVVDNEKAKVDYAIAFSYYNYETREWYLVCTCEQISTDADKRIMKCQNCGNDNVISTHRRNLDKKEFFADTKIDCIEKDNSGFHIKKTDVMVTFDAERHFISNVRFGESYEFKLSFKTKTLTGTKDGVPMKVRALGTALNNSKRDKLINAISTENNKEMYAVAFEQLAKMNYERSIMYDRALNRLMNAYSYFQILCSAGWKASYSIINLFDYVDKTKTKPHEILRIPKYTAQFIKESKYLYIHHLEVLSELDKVIGGNNLKTALTLLQEEADNVNIIFSLAENIITLSKIGHIDIAKLIMYLIRDVKLNQGIGSPSEALTLLKDYISMSTDMGIEYESFPKSLKKEHDITAMNYKVVADELKNKKFKEIVDSKEYSMLQYSAKDYSIVLPQSPQDLVNEGSSLSHCIASYVDSVLKHKCKIVFLRETENIDKPLVSIEIRGNNVRQARKFGNQNPTDEQLAFISKWAKKKKINVELW